MRTVRRWAKKGGRGPGHRPIPVIPNNPTRNRHHPSDQRAYRLRNVIERTFSRLKDWRRFATRYDRLAQNFPSATASTAAQRS
ncbi:MAG: transposase [Pseudomonadota bacterium]